MLPLLLVLLFADPAPVAQHPQGSDLVKLRFTITRADGKVLESIPADKAAVMSLERMMPGWRAAVQTMVRGEKRVVSVPAEETGGKSAEALTIDTELVDILPGPQTPADVAAPPADAERTRSGLASKVLKPGTGTRKPNRRSKVQVNYSGWTTDGRLFDSTMLRGVPAEFPLDKVIAGWTEGLQLMVEGETRRFWIPAKLAYEGKPDAPQGMLVFDIELLAIR